MQDEILIEEPKVEEHLQRDVEESIRQGSTKPFIEEAVLQVSKWGFSVADLQVQKKCQQRGILTWLMSIYSDAECELTGFLGQIHIWQVCAYTFSSLYLFHCSLFYRFGLKTCSS